MSAGFLHCRETAATEVDELRVFVVALSSTFESRTEINRVTRQPVHITCRAGS